MYLIYQYVNLKEYSMGKYITKMYVPTDKPNWFIKVGLSFNKDTWHWATSQPKEKGYQVNCTPIERTLGDGYKMEHFGAFEGFYEIIYPIGRQSAKRAEHAKKLLEENMVRYMDFFRAKGFNIEAYAKENKESV